MRTGYHLRSLIQNYGFRLVDDVACRCDEIVTLMNEWGSDLCEQHFDEIVDWMMDSADKIEIKGIPIGRFVPDRLERFVATQLLTEAIRRSRISDQ